MPARLSPSNYARETDKKDHRTSIESEGKEKGMQQSK